MSIIDSLAGVDAREMGHRTRRSMTVVVIPVVEALRRIGACQGLNEVD
jgi:hypothetical protein